MQKCFISLLLGICVSALLFCLFMAVEFIFISIIAIGHKYPDIPIAGIFGFWSVALFSTPFVYVFISDIDRCGEKKQLKKLSKRKTK